MGIDKSVLNEDEINKLLKMTSEKSLLAIQKQTEALAGEGYRSDGMGGSGNDMKVSEAEIEEFLKEVSSYNYPKISRKDLKKYLDAFTKKPS